jgi:hypothetical protein
MPACECCGTELYAPALDGRCDFCWCHCPHLEAPPGTFAGAVVGLMRWRAHGALDALQTVGIEPVGMFGASLAGHLDCALVIHAECAALDEMFRQRCEGG